MDLQLISFISIKQWCALFIWHRTTGVLTAPSVEGETQWNIPVYHYFQSTYYTTQNYNKAILRSLVSIYLQSSSLGKDHNATPNHLLIGKVDLISQARWSIGVLFQHNFLLFSFVTKKSSWIHQLFLCEFAKILWFF